MEFAEGLSTSLSLSLSPLLFGMFDANKVVNNTLEKESLCGGIILNPQNIVILG